MLGFSVLPPPPRYPGTGAYGASGLGGIVPLIETNNTLEKPTGSEWQFLVGEGTYVLKEDLILATPPPHPSEAPIVNPNPLATNPQPASAGTKLSLVSLHPRPPPFSYKGPTAASSSSLSVAGLASATDDDDNDEADADGARSSSGGEGGRIKRTTTRTTSGSDAQGLAVGDAAPAFGQGNAALAMTVTRDVNKRKKPKNSATKSNSSFISRVIVNDGLGRRLADRPVEGLFAFANINRAFQWLDLSWTIKEYLTKILFTKAHCLCHHVNTTTKGASHLDVIMGFSTGEIIWLEPISQRYTRLNKNGVINNTPVAHIEWIPGSENLFLAGHMDGSLVVYDKEKEDAAFLPEDETSSHGGSEAGEATNGTAMGVRMLMHKSVQSKNQKTNPVAAWKLSNQRIHAFAFSPDKRHLAVVSEDGTLRIIDYLHEELLDLFFSYYDGFSCVTWTPDGKYVLTGGQDDLISIWSMADSALVARCQGHESWVAALAFDPWRCDEGGYRFGSVGEDGRLCLWDFSAVMLYRPRGQQRHGGTVSSKNEGVAGRVDGHDGERSGIIHAVESSACIQVLPPVMTKIIDRHPLCWLEFTEDAIITSCKTGHIRTWNRPGMGAAKDEAAVEGAATTKSRW